MAYQKRKNQDSRTNGQEELGRAIRLGMPERLYVFCGEEAFLRENALRRLKASVLSGPAEAFNFHHLPWDGFSVTELQEAVEAPPMMAERTLIQVDDLPVFDTGRIGEEVRQKLIGILSDIPSWCTVVFLYDTAEWKPDGRLKKLADLFRTKAHVVTFDRLGENDLIKWAKKGIQGLGGSISDDAVRLLIRYTDYNMMSMHGELEKLASAVSGRQVERQDVESLVEPVLTAAVFDITDRLAERDYEKALQTLRELFSRQEEPEKLLGLINAQLRRMYYSKVLAEKGRGADTLAAFCGLREYPAGRITSAARQVSRQWCAAAVELGWEAAKGMRSAGSSPDRQLELLILGLAALPREERRRG